MVNENNIFYSDYAHRWCLGTNVSKYNAIKLQSVLNIAYGLGQSVYQVLANKETDKYEKEYNLIITAHNEDQLSKIVVLLNQLLDKIENK